MEPRSTCCMALCTIISLALFSSSIIAGSNCILTLIFVVVLKKAGAIPLYEGWTDLAEWIHSAAATAAFTFCFIDVGGSSFSTLLVLLYVHGAYQSGECFLEFRSERVKHGAALHGYLGTIVLASFLIGAICICVSIWQCKKVRRVPFLFPNKETLAELRRTSNPLMDNMMVLAAAERWRTIRPACSPAFSTGKLRKMHALIQDCARITCQHLKEAAERKEDIDVKRFFGHYSLDVIARCAFGTRLDSHTDATNEFVTQASKAFSARISWRLLIAVLFPGLVKLFSFKVTRGDGFEYFKRVCQRIITERRQGGHRHEDFLQLMMDAQDGSLAFSDDGLVEPEDKLFDVGSETKLASPSSTKRLSEIEAMAQCVLFFLAGQETTSSTVAFAAYLLALNPDVQEKLRKEVDDCIEANASTFPTLYNFPLCIILFWNDYNRRRVTRLLAIHVSKLERSGYHDYVLGDTGIKLPKECSILIPVYSMHHDPELFPDPESFKPERQVPIHTFSDENVDSIQPYTYLPFGAGPRNCIGMRLALQSVKLCLLHSVRSVRFVRTGKTKVPLSIKRGLGVLTAEDIIVGIRKRPDQAA
ncbi:hypothetical protein HPB50_008904 [Hyalomma asiaticum]|uniref:Uncharacterized protein n=1 Tax=Hyalomma asiaticum TaxID=266040 RepID=A0ACB7RHX3_HYAAI|nr:hypothetical protein HPB50_008904 [Hyalomma asiaticum]